MKISLLALALLIAVSCSTASIAEGLNLSGDIRLRNETIDQEGKELRNRQRIRTRVTAATKLNDEFSVEIRVATGSSDTPISTNQTLDGGFSSKAIWIDRAFIKWAPKAVEGLSLSGGKVKNPFVTVGKSQLLWDSDLNPEGISANFSHSVAGASYFINAASFAVDERKTDDDAWLLGAQAGVGYGLDAGTLTAGAGYYSFSNAEGNAPFVESAGNTLDAAGNYLNEYNEVEVFVEFTTKIKDLPFALYANGVNNTGADDDNTGYLAGFNLGKCKKEGSWELKYNYEQLEKDAVIGALSDSDFAGGGTDGSGHKFGLGYQLSPPVKLSATYFLNQVGVDNGSDYHRIQLDMSAKF